MFVLKLLIVGIDEITPESVCALMSACKFDQFIVKNLDLMYDYPPGIVFSYTTRE